MHRTYAKSGISGSNRRPTDLQSATLPTELMPDFSIEPTTDIINRGFFLNMIGNFILFYYEIMFSSYPYLSVFTRNRLCIKTSFIRYPTKIYQSLSSDDAGGPHPPFCFLCFRVFFAWFLDLEETIFANFLEVFFKYATTFPNMDLLNIQYGDIFYDDRSITYFTTRAGSPYNSSIR